MIRIPQLSLLPCSNRLKNHALILVVIATVVSLGGCASAGTISAVTQIAGFALETAGLKKPAGPPQPKLVPVRIHAGSNLNADSSGRGLAVVVKIYKLRDATAFMQAPYDAFVDAAKGKEMFGSDVIEMREAVLTPGQRLETKEKMTQEMGYLGIVSLFRSPAPERWRFAFAQTDIEKNGVTIGVHACALTVTEGKTQGASGNSPALLSPVQCH